MKKKILTNMVLVAMVATLSACGSAKEDTVAPTNAPVISTEAPVETSVPTDKPDEVVEETIAPTEAPVVEDTEAPTEEPIAEQTTAPTEEPKATETVVPTDEPVKATEAPTEKPTKEPVAVTEAPTEKPVVTTAPTEKPVVTVSPTNAPVATAAPTAQPTVTPTEPPQITPAPTVAPTPVPTVAPTEAPCQHSWTIECTPSTCTTHGIQKEYCSKCGKNTTFEIPLVDHNMVNGVCSSCGQTDATVHVHNWVLSSTIQAPTCGCIGIGNYRCVDCNDVKTDDIPKTTNHNHVKITDGCANMFSKFECTVCYDRYTTIDSSCSDGNSDGLCDKCNGLVQ